MITTGMSIITSSNMILSIVDVVGPRALLERETRERDWWFVTEIEAKMEAGHWKNVEEAPLW